MQLRPEIALENIECRSETHVREPRRRRPEADLVLRLVCVRREVRDPLASRVHIGRDMHLSAAPATSS